MAYPNILTSLSGNPITTKEGWEKHRRNEILTLFQNFVFGIPPIERPEKLSFDVEIIEREQDIIQKKVTISFPEMSFEADVFLPKKHGKPLPAFLMIMHEYHAGLYNYDTGLDFEAVPILDAIKRGYAFVCFRTSGICPDFFEHRENAEKLYCDGIFTKLKYTHRPNSWSILAAWAWGASRIMDYIERDEDIDKDNVCVIGHSRSGKTALWAAATDTRFKMAVSNCSGCTGAAFTRGKQGEHLKDINDVTHWFSENYSKYNDDEDMLPVDQHMLLSLIAPRPLYVASASEDDWADPEHELLSCKLAGDAYGLYGLKGVVLPEEGIENDVSYSEGQIAYHKKTGEHCLQKSDWKLFMDFADKHLK